MSSKQLNSNIMICILINFSFATGCKTNDQSAETEGSSILSQTSTDTPVLIAYEGDSMFHIFSSPEDLSVNQNGYEHMDEVVHGTRAACFFGDATEVGQLITDDIHNSMDVTYPIAFEVSSQNLIEISMPSSATLIKRCDQSKLPLATLFLRSTEPVIEYRFKPLVDSKELTDESASSTGENIRSLIRKKTNSLSLCYKTYPLVDQKSLDAAVAKLSGVLEQVMPSTAFAYKPTIVENADIKSTIIEVSPQQGDLESFTVLPCAM